MLSAKERRRRYVTRARQAVPRDLFKEVMDIVFHTVDDLVSGIQDVTHWITNGQLVDARRIWPKEWGNWRRLGYRPPSLPDIFGVDQRVPRGPTPRTGPGGWRYAGRADHQNAIQDAIEWGTGNMGRRGLSYAPHNSHRDNFTGRPTLADYRLWARDSDPLVYNPDIYRDRVAPWPSGRIGEYLGFWHGVNMDMSAHGPVY